VLKGQQSSWKRNHEKVEKTLQEQTKKMLALEGENMELKVEI
jgi:hypothetical protein